MKKILTILLLIVSIYGHGQKSESFGWVNVDSILMSNSFGDTLIAKDTGDYYIFTNGRIPINAHDLVIKSYVDSIGVVSDSSNRYVQVINSYSVALAKGIPVEYVSGSVTLPTVGKSRAGVYPEVNHVGFTAEIIAANDTGLVLVSGLLEGVNTASCLLGYPAYVSGTTAGTIDNLQPTDGISIMVGYPVNLETNGILWVTPPQINKLYASSGLTGYNSGAPENVDQYLTTVNSVRAIYINATVGRYGFVQAGENYDDTGDVATIPDTDELSFVYYDNDFFLEEQNPSESEYKEILQDKVITASAYWDADNDEFIYFSNDRHENTSNSADRYRIRADGYKYVSGLDASNVVADGDGSSNTHAQYGLNSGIYLDVNISNNNPSFSVGDSLAIYYMNSSDYLRRDFNDGFNVLVGGSGLIQFNDGGTLTEATSTNYVLYHIFATNAYHDSLKVFSAVGLSEYSSLTGIADSAVIEINTIKSELPFKVKSEVYTFIYQTNSAYSNDVKGRTVSVTNLEGETVDYLDWREGAPSTGSGGSGATTYLDLSDTDNSYTGQETKVPQVNDTEDGLDFVDYEFYELTDVIDTAWNNHHLKGRSENGDSVIFSEIISDDDTTLFIDSPVKNPYVNFGNKAYISADSTYLMVTNNSAQDTLVNDSVLIFGWDVDLGNNLTNAIAFQPSGTVRNDSLYIGDIIKGEISTGNVAIQGNLKIENKDSAGYWLPINLTDSTNWAIGYDGSDTLDFIFVPDSAYIVSLISSGAQDLDSVLEVGNSTDKNILTTGTIQANNFISTTTTVAPLTVLSSVLVNNLNSELLNGQTGPYYDQDISTDGTPGDISIDNNSTLELNVFDGDSSATNELDSTYFAFGIENSASGWVRNSTVKIDTTNTNPAGSNYEIQFNDNGNFGASSYLSWDDINYYINTVGVSGESTALGSLLKLNDVDLKVSSNSYSFGNFGQYSATTITNSNNYGYAGQYSATTISNSNNYGYAGQYSTTTISNSDNFGYYGQYTATTITSSDNFGRAGQYSATTITSSNNFGNAGQRSATTISNSNNFGYIGQYAATTITSSNNYGYAGQYSATTITNSDAFGYNAARYTSTGSDLLELSNSLHLGYNTRSLNSTSSNEIVIGANAVGAGNNTATIGNSNIDTLFTSGSVVAKLASLDKELSNWGQTKGALSYAANYMKITQGTHADSAYISTTGGEAIDSFYVDYNSTKTGVDGYIKNSSDSIFIPASGSGVLTTKGDLYTYTTESSRLGVGSDDQLLKSNSSTVTGLEWFSPDYISAPSPTNGDMLYYNSGWNKLLIGDSKQTIEVSGGLPVWTDKIFTEGTGGISYDENVSIGDGGISSNTSLYVETDQLHTIYAYNTKTTDNYRAVTAVGPYGIYAEGNRLGGAAILASSSVATGLYVSILSGNTQPAVNIANSSTTDFIYCENKFVVDGDGSVTANVITCDSIYARAAGGAWPDHVFKSDYYLPDFKTEIEYIKNASHLRSIPSEEYRNSNLKKEWKHTKFEEKQKKINGRDTIISIPTDSLQVEFISLQQMQLEATGVLEEVEKLYLYLDQAIDRIDELEARIEKLETKNKEK